ncbi:2-hydroxychromene-2-carboxylate isomerase/DsbA-like thioredoxin domain [Actinomycetales bacterium JB111]|nr:2-hydroxychromene-2-carboxylate isomerase/DsbA-like thioredoxin domain [Actinomycetales bacterium JB111]
MVGEAYGGTAEKVVIDVWSDVMCPFCYLGDKHLELALEQFPHRDQVELRYHSFLLMPELSADTRVGLNELLASHRGMPLEQAAEMNAQFAERGAPIGLDYRMDDAIATSTRSAHRLSHFAALHGRQHEMVIRLFKAYFTDGLFLGDHEVLADLAAEVGLDRAEALAALESGAFEEEVDADLRQAQEIGIRGVPFFVFDGRFAVSGAQPVEGFTQALETTWAEREKRSSSA